MARDLARDAGRSFTDEAGAIPESTARALAVGEVVALNPNQVVLKKNVGGSLDGLQELQTLARDALLSADISDDLRRFASKALIATLDLPEEILDVASVALSPRPSLRYNNAQRLSDALERYRLHAEILNRFTSLNRRFKRLQEDLDDETLEINVRAIRYGKAVDVLNELAALRLETKNVKDLQLTQTLLDAELKTRRYLSNFPFTWPLPFITASAAQRCDFSCLYYLALEKKGQIKKLRTLENEKTSKSHFVKRPNNSEELSLVRISVAILIFLAGAFLLSLLDALFV